MFGFHPRAAKTIFLSPFFNTELISYSEIKPEGEAEWLCCGKLWTRNCGQSVRVARCCVCPEEIAGLGTVVVPRRTMFSVLKFTFGPLEHKGFSVVESKVNIPIAEVFFEVARLWL